MLVIMETALIEWHGKRPGGCQGRARVITCYQDGLTVNLSKIEGSQPTLTLMNYLWKHIQELA